MATSSLLKPVPIVVRDSRYQSIRWNSSLRFGMLEYKPNLIKVSEFCRKDLNLSSVHCVLNSKQCSIIDLEEENEERSQKKLGFVSENTAAMAATILGLLVITFDQVALAASGGRIGGKSFPSSSSSSRSSSTRSSESESRPSSSSSTRSSKSYSSSSSSTRPSESYSSRSSSSWSSPSRSTESRPSSTSRSSSSSTGTSDSGPSISYSSSLSYTCPSESYSSPSRSSSTPSESDSSPSTSLRSSESSPPLSKSSPKSSTTTSRSTTDLLHSSTSYAPSPRSSKCSSFQPIGIIIMSIIAVGTVAALIAFVKSLPSPPPEEQTSVIKLQVCLLGMARSLQKDLEQLAEVADTSTPEGLNYILKEATLPLLRHPDYCISSCSSVVKKKASPSLRPDTRLMYVKQSFEDGEERFDRLSIEERGKFDEETLFNVNNIKMKMTSRRKKETGSRNEYIVVTILVAAAGEQNFPPMTNIADLKEALQKLGSIPPSKTMAVEVLWTPQEEDDTLTEEELLEKYPLLKPLHDG